MDPSPALRDLIYQSRLSVPEIASKSGVNERSFRRWYYRHTEKLNFVSAGLIYHALTGKTLIPAAKPSRKGRAA
jgi:hypothetical protein